ncbi:hypothetical protein B7P43_G03035 [Cryptotermes secundus]|uniref:Cuticle protein 19 n=1 Tax=Cryptotermes secundus TaxID=105785 RepID=A0A2J7PWD9_9NEOP|nr:hypothetical protein B7P43_G03035 [Cryptotermes secundus]
MFYPSNSIFPTNYFTDSFRLRGWYNMPISGQRTRWTQPQPNPKKIKSKRSRSDAETRILERELNNEEVVAAVLLLAVCSQAYPIQVQEDVQHGIPEHIEQLLQHVPQVQYSHEPEAHDVEVHHDAHPKYEFKYGVKDTHTHDIKEQAEKRDGHKVEGYYKLLEPDGTTRTVHYTADKHTGFHAQVEKSGHAIHPVIQHEHQ